jgi:hypothetical protein
VRCEPVMWAPHWWKYLIFKTLFKSVHILCAKSLEMAFAGL